MPYVTEYPLSKAASYSGGQVLEFLSDANAGMIYQGATWTLDGEIKCTLDGTNVVKSTDAVYFDMLSGFHGMINELDITLQGTGFSENLLNYGRIVHMKNVATRNLADLGSGTADALEGLAPSNAMTNGLMNGRLNLSAVDADDQGYIPFSLKLDCMLNNSGDLPADLTGQIKVRMVLARGYQFMFGEDTTVNTQFTVKSPRLRCQVRPLTDRDPTQLALNYRYAYTTQIESNNQTLYAYIPGVSTGVHMSFISQNNESNVTKNFYATAPVPGIPPENASAQTSENEYGFQKVVYSINANNSVLKGYTMDSREDILRTALDSYGSRKNQSTLINLMRRPNNPDGYLLGIQFPGAMNFSGQKFGAQLRSQVGQNGNGNYRAFIVADMVKVM